MKPNIIFIMTDQQRLDTIAALGHDHMITPFLDKLANKSAVFQNAIVPGATCVASRAAIFTGLYGHNTGVYSFDHWSHHQTWVEDFAQAGYHCVNLGKMHVSPRDDKMAFHERVVVENPTTNFLKNGGVDDAWGRYLSINKAKRPLDRHKTDPKWRDKTQAVPWHLDEALHPDVFVGQVATSYINNYEGGDPLFLQIGFTGPHEPYDPLMRDVALYEDKEVPMPIQRQHDLKDRPIQQRAHIYFNQTTDHESQIDLKNTDDAHIINMRKHYYAKITGIDRQLHHIFEALEHKGMLDNAIVVFLSDHGDMLGDYNLPYKWLMYDQIVKVPLLVWDTREKSQMKSIDAPVSLLDIGPTLLDMVGISSNKSFDGKSLKLLISGETTQSPHDYVLCEDNYLTMLRNDRYKLVTYTYQEDDGELYDLEKDPLESINCFHKPEYQTIKQTLMIDLLKEILRSTYNAAPVKNKGDKEHLLKPFKHHYLHPRCCKDDLGYLEISDLKHE